jgi:manganese transport system ATP-binding protein
LVIRYDGRTALEESTFEIPSGGITALIGPNGSGKSSLLNAITGLVPPAAGRLAVPPDGGRPRRVSYVLQATKVDDSLPITVREIVAMSRYAGKGPYTRLDADDRRAIDEAMVRMDLKALAGRHLRELSGGQRQRVFVAQGLAQDHDMLLLDEPLSGLDLPSARAIDRVIHDESANGCTVVMTTHDLAEAQAADHVLLLAGRVIASGPPGEALTADNLTAAYGAGLLHEGSGGAMIEDPAHQPVPGRHAHRERSIHVEPPGSELHGDG